MKPHKIIWAQWSKVLWAVVITAISLLLTGCVGVIEADITLYSGEKWKAKIDLTLTQQDVSMAGGEPAIEAELQRQAAQLRQQCVRYSWRKEQTEGNVVYHFSVEGQGWAAGASWFWDMVRAVSSGQSTLRPAQSRAIGI